MRHTFYSPANYDPIDPRYMKVEKVSNDPKRPEETRHYEVANKPLLKARVLQLLEERAKELLLPIEDDVEEFDDSLYLAVQAFSQLLEKLKKENISEDSRFTEELSHLWLILNEHASSDGQERYPPLYYPKLKSFLQTLIRYPEKSDHTFGYYLNHYAGEKWLPFPFMDLLSKLHEDHIVLKSKSTLSLWVFSLTTILNMLVEEE
jgi:hypothetical protein